MAKRLVIVFLPLEKNRISSCNRYSDTFEEWLNAYFLVISSPSLPIPLGLIRESYILDLTSPSSPSIPSSPSPREIEWDVLELRISGINGNLPNMDLAAVALQLFPADFLVSEAGPSWCLNGGWPLHLPLPLQIDREYGTRLCGQIAHLEALVLGPSGLHGQLLRRNVDALTLRPLGLRPKERRKGQKKGRGIDELVKVIAKLVYISSNLSGERVMIRRHCMYINPNPVIEELHHSFFFYILIGRDHFMASHSFSFFLCLKLSGCLGHHRVWARGNADAAPVAAALPPTLFSPRRRRRRIEGRE
jgi:hypothetical protein